MEAQSLELTLTLDQRPASSPSTTPCLPQVCTRILQTANQVNNEEWQFFLKGGNVLDRSAQPANPAPLWISEEAWDNITVGGVGFCCGCVLGVFASC